MDINILILIMLGLMLILLIIVTVLMVSREGKGKNRQIEEKLIRLSEKQDASSRSLESQSEALRREMNEAWRSGMQAQSAQLRRMSDSQSAVLREMSDRQEEKLTRLENQQKETTLNLQKENAAQREAIIRTLIDAIDRLQSSNEEKLGAIQGVVSEKLDKTLNERLDANFSQVTRQLGKLYQSLGELKELSGGVADLNRTLSNVKTRGNWGEMQLERILNETMSRSQYDVNVATKRQSRERVEFAIKFPSQEVEGEWVYLPIDAKFPADIYNKILQAAEDNDSRALEAGKTELKNRIRHEAASISGKYLDPPYTTSYALMYLPTEGLYAEVLRLEGLSEECQKKGVIITGPTTITALLNSLQAGFRNLTLSKKSLEVMRLLEAVKGQLTRLDEAVERTQKKLGDAAQLTEDLKKRTGRLASRMRNIGEVTEETSDQLLGIERSSGNIRQDEEET